MRAPKIIGGIPTHARTSAPAVAERMLEICDHVLIVAQCTELEIPERIAGKVTVDYRDEPSQLEARNTIIDFGELMKADWILVSDDDLYWKPGLLTRLLEQTKYQFLGSLCSESSLYYYFNRNTVSMLNGEYIDWIIRPHPAQLWLIRTETVREVGNLALEAMQDCEWGLRAWAHGWASARLHADKDTVHTQGVGRMKKTAEAGGQTPEMRAQFMPIAINYMADKYMGVEGKFNLLKVMRQLPDNPNRTHITRFNWEQMTKNLHDRWGVIGYKEYKEGKLRKQL